MLKAFVLADDLTGSIEVAAQFAKHGTRSEVTTDIRLDRDCFSQHLGLRVVDTESRHMSAEQAQHLTYRLSTIAREHNIRWIYKKTDSTLRGNIGTELAGIMKAYPEKHLVYLPAYPKLGRVCRQGHLYVEGKRLEDTAFAKDPRSPVRNSSILDLLTPHIQAPVVTVETPQDLNKRLRQQTKPTVFVCDAETDRDLQTIAQLLNGCDVPPLLAGPAGVTEYLAQLLGTSAPQVTRRPTAHTSVTLCGSVNSASLAQINHAERSGISVITWTPEQLLDPDFTDTQNGQHLIQAMAEQLNAEKHLIMASLRSADEMAAYLAHANKLGLSPQQTHNRVAQQMGRITKKLFDWTVPDALIIFGGDTALGMLNACQCSTLEPVGEILSGIPVSDLNVAGRTLQLITKAGGYGSPDMLSQVVHSLSKNT